jgi:hypothetical protein
MKYIPFERTRFPSKIRSKLSSKADDVLGTDWKGHGACPANIAWMIVGGLVVLTGLVLLVREIPAMVREVRIMRM